MKSIFALLVLAVLAVVTSAQHQHGTPLALENIDVDNTLRNDKLVRRYIDCVLERGRCDQNGRDLKGMLPRVLNEGCNGCTPKQKANTDRITDFMRSNHPNDWAMINVKYSSG